MRNNDQKRVLCPKFKYGDGYAILVDSAKKEHCCVKCKKRINEKTPYVSVHHFVEKSRWSSYPICLDCHEKLTHNRVI